MEPHKCQVMVRKEENKYKTTNTEDDHDCFDDLDIYYRENEGGWNLRIFGGIDGATVIISWCPFCGVKLPIPQER